MFRDLAAQLVSQLVSQLVTLEETTHLAASKAILAAEDSAPLSAFVWWLIPLFGFLGAIAYVIWISKFQTKYENQTTRSVDRFQKFQQSLDKDQRQPRSVREIRRNQGQE